MLLVELTLESILVPMILCLENEFVRLGLSPLFHAAMNNRCFTKCFNISPTITRCTLCYCNAPALAVASGSLF